ncbi:hypothetical protein OAK17_05945 [Alphaproteobacteria bacterium]|nr:hypothetical protein [Alphaproteobacteria bacterium]
MDNYIQDPLKPFLERFSELKSNELKIESLGYKTQINLRLPESQISAIEIDLDVIFPRSVNLFTHNKDYQVLCLGPDEWLFISDLNNKDSLIYNMNKIRFDDFVSISDVSFNRNFIEISGEKCIDLITSISSFPMKDFKSGECVQSEISKIQVILMCIETDYKYNILVRSSFSRFLSEVIIDQTRLL